MLVHRLSVFLLYVILFGCAVDFFAMIYLNDSLANMMKNIVMILITIDLLIHKTTQ